MDLRLYFGVIWRFRYLVDPRCRPRPRAVVPLDVQGERPADLVPAERDLAKLRAVASHPNRLPLVSHDLPVYAIDQATGQPITNTPFADPSRYASLAVF